MPSQKTQRGRKSFATGFKKEFLQRGLLAYRTALESKHPSVAVSKFYSDFMVRWILKYGYDLPLNKNLDKDEDDPMDDMVEAFDEGLEELSPDERQKRATYRDELRTVRDFLFEHIAHTKCPQKLSGWFRHENNKLRKTNTSRIDLKILETRRLDKPKHLPLWQYYSQKYYHERVKVAYEVEWARITKQPLPKGKTRPPAISIRTSVIKAKLAQESSDFRDILAKQAAEDYEQQLTDYNEQAKVIETLSPAMQCQQ